MNWIETQIITASAGVDALCAMLTDLGIKGFSIADPADFQEFLQNKEGKWDYIDQDLLGMAQGDTTVTVYLPDNAQGAEQLVALRAMLAQIHARDDAQLFGTLELTLKNVREEDWANNWKQYFKPFTVGERLLIKPSWETCENPRNRAVLEIDPASSFGTGQHHTTRLCLELLEQLMHPGDRVLDLGCGSGILSIGALLLGASGATAVDIEENAAATATENARKNHIDPTLYRVFCGNVLEDETLCREIGDGYDLICANIVADVLIAMKQLFRRFLRPEGTLIVSGIIMERRDEVLDQLKSAGFTLLEVREKEGWAAASLRIS
ncbi:50S ribosomal protein L11 methyltransferase [Ruminococcus champanellensis]|uniref:Ribosomal protein L11 methyltransferase n=1 Tax=Ruminococcus champanellensis (strain DSM 18848 / JCM 17042 / KCTC 15320 / 18P13) TaxID=213810 RepID=D4LBE5_RUMC1|nr:50S ribosomal protein L11 methyltransferase [Ruminococcus champanellensis]MED9891188.1 50S ribosomal protein L11 methyltransferase [Ruminococcus champanellensis]CBL16940.1 ribosomal protein L11 methyltransferase [Ruminococcus champanellensis 18P13 = JCM 17042]